MALPLSKRNFWDLDRYVLGTYYICTGYGLSFYKGGSMAGPVKSTFVFDQAADSKLRDLADRKSVSKTEILRRAIALYDYLESQQKPGAGIRIEKPSGEKVDLVLP